MDHVSLAANLATTFSLLVALIALYMQSKQNTLTLGVTILRDIERQFETKEMRNTRLEVATFLLVRQDGTPPIPQCADLLDFFDVLGTYHNRKTLDTEMTWVQFYYWFGNYWYLLKDDSLYYEDLAGGVRFYEDARILFNTLTTFGERNRGLPVGNYFTSERLNTFLKEEIAQCS